MIKQDEDRDSSPVPSPGSDAVYLMATALWMSGPSTHWCVQLLMAVI